MKQSGFKEAKMNGNKSIASGTFLTGVLMGGLAGAAVALFLAPQSGQETRQQIRQKGIELRGQAEDTLNEAYARVEAVAADMRRRAADFQAQGQVILEEGQRQLAQAVQETKKAAAVAASQES
jgi:gas vesicle protein